MVYDLTDSDSVLRYAIYIPEGPLGTTGTSELDMNVDICITPRVVKAFPLIALERSQRETRLEIERVLSKEHVL